MYWIILDVAWLWLSTIIASAFRNLNQIRVTRINDKLSFSPYKSRRIRSYVPPSVVLSKIFQNDFTRVRIVLERCEGRWRVLNVGIRVLNAFFRYDIPFGPNPEYASRSSMQERLPFLPSPYENGALSNCLCRDKKLICHRGVTDKRSRNIVHGRRGAAHARRALNWFYKFIASSPQPPRNHGKGSPGFLEKGNSRTAAPSR